MNRKQLLAVLAAFAVVTQMSVAAVAAGALGMDTEADQYPETKFVEDELTIVEHDRSSMSWLQVEDDNGKIQTIDAHVNGSASGAKVAYRADKIDAEALDKFPIVSDEENNSVTWLNAGNWSTSSSAISATDADGTTGDGVQAVQITTDGSLTSGASENAGYSESDVTSDAEKRYLQLVLNVENLAGDLEVQVHDGNGDYVAAYANSTANASDAHVIANQTASGVIYQEQLGNLQVQGSGNGDLDGVQEVRFVVSDADVTATVTGLNAEKKSQWDFGTERVPDESTDDTDDYTDETVTERPHGGEIEAADLSGLGSAFSDATLYDLTYMGVEYRMQDKPSAVSVEFRDAGDTYPSFDSVLDVSYRRTLPAYYDIEHGNLTLETNQTFLSERYVTIRYAEGVGDTETSEIADSEWIDISGSLGDKGTWITADDTVSSDTTYVIQLEPKLTESQNNALEIQQSGGGFWGSSGGGNPFMSLYNWIAGGVVGLLSALGLKAKAGS